MQKEVTNRPEIKLVGISKRTDKRAIVYKDHSTNPVFDIVKKYFHTGLGAQIKNRKNPGTTFCVYAKYDTDDTGEFSYFIGEEVTSFDDIGEEFETLTIPASKYAKFTSAAGTLPGVRIDVWDAILQMNPIDLG